MKENDDNNWADYTADYMHQIIGIYKRRESEFFITLSNVDYVNDELVLKDDLHPNAKELYNTVYKLHPESVMEVGCGGCYHLKNIHLLVPEIRLYGIDITMSQIDFGRWFSDLPQEVGDNLIMMDATENVPEDRYEFVFTQAVVMHQSTDNAIKIMKNMKDMSTKYIFMIENPGHHGGEDVWRSMVSGVFTDCEISYESRFNVNSILITKP